MKELNVYKKQYNQLIEVYSDLLLQYYILTKQFEETGYEVVVATEKSDGKKARFLQALKICGKT
jgi:nitrogenase molybdenum-iron protein alpha/beta subunit